jgi:dTDP-4-dehydrorhamnose 3,5-epimerase|tara:strand:- start:198 stop:611 length:414 start_codon:yes stop_codon:yes gene_type:complete
MITINDVKLLELKTFVDSEGSLVPLESGLSIPFEIKRVFYVFGVHDQKDRGEHSHYKTEQVLICLSGRVRVLCDDGKNRKEWTLDKPNQALYIPNLIWDEQTYLSPDSVLLVLANTKYDELDYIVDYDEFKKLKVVT